MASYNCSPNQLWFQYTICILLLAACIALPLQGTAQDFSAPQQEEFGQLFTSPEERAYLDGLRAEFLERTESQGFNIQAEELSLLKSQKNQKNVAFKLGAIINNQTGGKAIWLNGAIIQELELPETVDLVTRNGQSVLRIRSATATHYLKPGQTLDLSTGEYWESFQRQKDSLPAETEAETNIEMESENISENSTNTKPNNPEGVVTINDLIEALQNIQTGTSDQPTP